MTRILAIDTTTDLASIALVEGGAVVEERALRPGDGFGQVIFAAIVSLLERRGLRVSDVDCFACATGPGTFTGVRIGLAAVKGLAECCGKRVAGVSNLRAMAFYGETHARAAVLDARRGEVYAAVYDASLRLVGDEVVTRLDAWLAAANASEVIEAPRLLAGAIGLIAARDGAFLDPASLDANYVRRTDAELALKES